MRSAADRAVLEVEGLRTHFFTKAGVVKAVDDVIVHACVAARCWASSANPAPASR